MSPIAPEAYRRRYLEPIARAVTTSPTLPVELAARFFYAPATKAAVERSFQELFDAGVRGGHRPTLNVLAARAHEVDEHLRTMRESQARYSREIRQREGDLADFARMHERHVRQLEQAVEAARVHARTYEESTFWRLTGPLRYVVHRVKITGRVARALMHSARLIPARLGTARQILKDQGAAELARRMRVKLFHMGNAPQGLRPRGELEPAIQPLEIASADAPRVSIIVPTYGQDLHTFTCLKAIATHAGKVPLEVIVMDDCAPQPAAQALAAVRGVRFERNATNLGFVGNCNRGAQLANGEFLLFLNNDAVLTPGAIEALLRVFEEHPDAGAVGAKLIYPDGRLQEAGGIVWRDGSAWNYGRGDDPSRPEYNYLREADYCSGACLLIPRALFAKLGGFDDRYAPAYCEDSDLCFKVREAGFKVYYQPLAEVVHFEGVSHGTSVAEGVKKHQVANREKLYARWKNVLAGHRVNGVFPRLERDRPASRRVLMVEACMLTPDQDSGSVRTSRLLHVMQSMGCKVTFVADNLDASEPYAGHLREQGIEVLCYPHTRSIEAYIEEHGEEFDVIVLARYYVAIKYIDAVRRYAPRALLILDTHDLHYLRTRRLAALEGSRALAQSAQSMYHQEIDCIRRVDVTWVVSPIEREILAREVPSARVIVQTNIHYPVARVAPFAEREGIVFVGGYRHPPNVDAALFYAREIVPHLRELLPGVTSYLIGSNAPNALRELHGDGVDVVGFVPDIAPWFDRCRLSVSPLRYGAGVKGKINHSMSFGMPVVATTTSVEGMHVVDGEEILVADDPRAFAEAVARLYRDESLWKRLSMAGLANVMRHFSPEAARRSVEETFAVERSQAKAA